MKALITGVAGFIVKVTPSAEVDEAIRLHEPLEAFLRQRKDENASLADGYRQLAQILGNLETER